MVRSALSYRGLLLLGFLICLIQLLLQGCLEGLHLLSVKWEGSEKHSVSTSSSHSQRPPLLCYRMAFLYIHHCWEPFCTVTDLFKAIFTLFSQANCSRTIKKNSSLHMLSSVILVEIRNQLDRLTDVLCKKKAVWIYLNAIRSKSWFNHEDLCTSKVCNYAKHFVNKYVE